MMVREGGLSIVVAVKDGPSNLPAILAALSKLGSDAEVILCCAGPSPEIDGRSGLTILSLPIDTLIPSLWSEGIRRARGAKVALTTGEFIPAPGWAGRLRAADIAAFAGVGGVIDNDPDASPRNWAIFFLRYSAFAPPARAGIRDEIAADNAVYDRQAILEHSELLEGGFWEPSFHRRFHAGGRKLMLDPEMVVVHHGTVPARSFATQRYLHGHAYGLERASRGGTGRNLALLGSSPLVAPLLLFRIVSRIATRTAYRAKLVPAFPWLVRFILAWSLGEAGGYFAALSVRRHGSDAALTKGHA